MQLLLFASSKTHLWLIFFKIHHSSVRLFSIAWALIFSRTCCVISVVWVVKLSNRWLNTLINKGEIHTEEANFQQTYFHPPNLVVQKDFHLPKHSFHLPNGSLVSAFHHPENGCQTLRIILIKFLISGTNCKLKISCSQLTGAGDECGVLGAIIWE